MLLMGRALGEVQRWAGEEESREVAPRQTAGGSIKSFWREDGGRAAFQLGQGLRVFVS